jgi:ABC-type branched-subunit amino acid transport system substrate-binding protein
VAFAAAYDARYGGQPERLAKLGYDAMHLLIEASKGATGRADMVAALKTVEDYKGASGTVTFGEHRENVHLPLYRIHNGVPIPLGGEREPVQP